MGHDNYLCPCVTSESHSGSSARAVHLSPAVRICSGMFVTTVCRLASHNSTNIANSFWWAKTQLMIIHSTGGTFELEGSLVSIWQRPQGQTSWYWVLSTVAHQRIHYQLSATMSLYMTHLMLKGLRQVSLHIWPRCSVAFAFMSKTWCKHDRVLLVKEWVLRKTHCLLVLPDLSN